VTIIPLAFDESDVGQRACRVILPATRETRVQRQDGTHSVETSIPPRETKGLSEERLAYIAHEAWRGGRGSGGLSSRDGTSATVRQHTTFSR
jgi:hypothetical protein